MTTSNTAPIALLRAAILTGPAAATAAGIWLAAADLDYLPPEQYPLLPLALGAIEDAAPEHPWLPRLRGISRRAWYANQLMLGAADKLTQRLGAAEIPVMLADAVSLALTAYVGRLRPIGALSLIVPCRRAEEACRILADQGWQGEAPAAAALSGSDMWVTSRRFRVEDPASASIRVHPRPVVGSAGGQLADLHWRAAAFWPSEAMDAAAWGRAWPLTLAGHPALALRAADQLARSCWLAAHPGPASLIALADVAALMAEGDIDWAIVLDVAAACHIGRTVSGVCAGVDALLGLSAPADALARLAALPVSPFETPGRVEIPVARTANRSQALAAIYTQYRRTAAARGLPPRPGDFLTFMQARWGCMNRRDLVRAITVRLRRKR